MNLEQLLKALRKKQDDLTALQEKAFSEAGTKEDLDAFEAGLNEVDTLEKKVALAERENGIRARSAERVRDPEIPAGEVTVAKQSLPVGVKGPDLIMYAAAAQVISRGTGDQPLKVLEDQGYGEVANLLGGVKVNGKAVNTLVSSEGGLLVPTPLSGGIMPLLRMDSTFLQANPVRVPLTNGQFVLARGLAGATASYIAEGALKPVSTPTFDSISLRAKKLAGIVACTEEAQRWTIGDIEGYIRADLTAALALTMDLNAWLGTGTGASPLGILNKVGVQTQSNTFAAPTTPTLAELDTMARNMILKLTSVNITNTSRWRWVMPYRTAMRFADMRVGAGTDGDYAFPEMNLGRAGGPVWKGIPVIVTSQLPTNGGAGTDETTIALVDFSHVLFGEEEGITVRMSNQASLDVTGAGSLVHLWQQNMFAILAEAMHDFGLRTVKAVVKSTAIRF